MEMKEKTCLIKNQVKCAVVKNKQGKYKGRKKTWSDCACSFVDNLEDAEIYKDAERMRKYIQFEPMLRDKGLTVQEVIVAEIVE